MWDRFIPNRSLMDMELAHSLMVPMDNKMTSTPTSSVSSPSRDEYRRRLKENMMLDSNGKPFRMLVFGEKPRACRRNRIKEEDLLLDRLRPTSRNHRLPKLAGQVLNAKNLLDDYYANILDWGKNNLLAIALGSSVYIRNQATGKARLLLTVNEDLPTSVSWSGDGKILAVGFTSSRIMLWDVAASRRVGTLMMHEDKVGSLCWNNNILTSGSRDTFIINHDVRILERSASYYHGHSSEVCGLRWSEYGNLLASGGNDKLVHVWEASNTSKYLHRFTNHSAAVRALAWCPFQSNLLASGGGSADQCIKIWNVKTGFCSKSINTGSQVCALEWNRHQKEILSAHGYSHNQLSLWVYPSMSRIADFSGHSARVLHLS